MSINSAEALMNIIKNVQALLDDAGVPLKVRLEKLAETTDSVGVSMDERSTTNTAQSAICPRGDTDCNLSSQVVLCRSLIGCARYEDKQQTGA